MSIILTLIVFSSQRETLQRLKLELDNLERQRREKQTSLKACEQAVIRHRRESSSLRIFVQTAQNIVEELQDALDRDAIEKGRLEALEYGLSEAKDEATTYEGSYEDSVVALDKARESMRDSKQKMSALDARIAEVDGKVLKAENKANKASLQREGALRLKNAAIESTEKAVQKKAAKESQRAEKVGIVAQFTEQAMEICPRVVVDIGESGESIEKKLEKLSTDLVRYEAR